MIRKLLEAFFSHKLLLLLPPLLIPGLVTPIAFMTTPSLYDAQAGVWVDHPAYLNYKDGFNQWVPPSTSQSARLSELLHTRAFLIDVAQRTSLAPLIGNPAGEARISDVIGHAVSIASGAGGDHLLIVHAQAPTAALSYELCKAIVDAYQEKNAADLSDQSDAAVQFYQGRVDDAQQSLTKATQDLRRYVVSRQASDTGGVTQSSDPSQLSLPATLLDPRFGALQSTQQQATSDYNSAQAALAQAQRDALASSQGQQYGFQVLDPPTMPTAPTSQTKKIVVYPIAALVVGLGLSAMLLILLVASDRSVRSETDVTAGLRVLGSLPAMKVRRVPKQLRSVATRRAIGSMAGAALPAPSGSK